MVGDRDAEAASLFISHLKNRLANRVQLTTDGWHAYLDAVEDAFGGDVDYAMLVKLYGASVEGKAGSAERRYSPAQVIGTRYQRICGAPKRAIYVHVFHRADSILPARRWRDVALALEWFLGRERSRAALRGNPFNADGRALGLCACIASRFGGLPLGFDVLLQVFRKLLFQSAGIAAQAYAGDGRRDH
jgi:hypothetical protein